jgi:Ca2+/H+ antiporter, TMEM165/GDT1 family
MRRSRFPRFLLFLLFIFAFIVPLSFIIMALWNNILVAVLHVSVINFWQALGLFALSRILFGGFPGKPGWAGHGRRSREMEEMRNKWFNLSPEERKNFKQNLRSRCGGEQTASRPEATGSETIQ